MDEGPFRGSRPADRRTVTRSEPTYRQPEELQTARVEPQPITQSTPTSRSKEKNTSNRFKLPIFIILGVVILGLLGWFLWSSTHKEGGTEIDAGKYQAVFFTNGQVYFGKLSPLNDGYMKLTDIFYLQTKSSDSDSSNPQKTSTNQNDVQLIKLGSEIHGPEDEMVVSKDQMLFYENLKTDGKVAQSIAQYKKSH